MLQKLDDAYIPDDLVAFYDALAAKGYHARQRESERFLHAVVLTREVAETYGLYRCLELGCAEGLMTKEIAPYFDTMVALDHSTTMIQMCPELDRVTFMRAGEQFALLNGVHEWDAILAFEVLEHMRDPRTCIEMALNSCKYLLASCPINEQPNPNAFNLDLYGREQKWADATGHIWYMDDDGFKSLFDDWEIVHYSTAAPCGFVVVKGSLA